MNGDEVDIALVEAEWEALVLEKGRTKDMTTPMLIEWIDQQLSVSNPTGKQAAR